MEKRIKYTELATSYHFIPRAIEATGFFGPQAHRFFQELIGEPQSYHHILQLIVVAVQRGNMHGTGATIVIVVGFNVQYIGQL